MIEGPNPLSEAVAAGAVIRDVFGLADDARSAELAVRVGATWIPVTYEVLEKLSATETPRGPVAVVEIPEHQSTRSENIWLDIADPGNAGTVIRTAAAFGFGVIVAPGAVDPWSPKVLRAGAGGHFLTPTTVGGVPQGQVIATVPAGGVGPSLIGNHVSDGPLTILIGNEAHGLSEGQTSTADVLVTIPMPGGIESLNAAVAAAILMYEVRRLRPMDIGS